MSLPARRGRGDRVPAKRKWLRTGSFNSLGERAPQIGASGTSGASWWGFKAARSARRFSMILAWFFAYHVLKYSERFSRLRGPRGLVGLRSRGGAGNGDFASSAMNSADESPSSWTIRRLIRACSERSAGPLVMMILEIYFLLTPSKAWRSVFPVAGKSSRTACEVAGKINSEVEPEAWASSRAILSARTIGQESGMLIALPALALPITRQRWDGFKSVHFTRLNSPGRAPLSSPVRS